MMPSPSLMYVDRLAIELEVHAVHGGELGKGEDHLGHPHCMDSVPPPDSILLGQVDGRDAVLDVQAEEGSACRDGA